MSKIIDFSSHSGELGIELRIDTIKKELKKERISRRKLRDLQEELYHLSLVLTDTLRNQATLTQSTMSQFLTKQVELGTLIYDCQNIFIDKKVDSLTQHAQKIAQESVNPCSNVSQKIGKLKKSIHSLTHKEALSLENRQMINLAKKYLHDAAAGCYSETAPKDTKTIRLDFKKANADQDLTDPYDISMSLYEISGDFYHGKVSEALSSFFCLSASLQHDLKQLMNEREINFEIVKQSDDLAAWNNTMYQVIQTLMGYSNQLLYHSLNYPSVQEIDSLFKDLDTILEENASANF